MSELALKLIAENKKTKATFLNLGNCGMTEVPEEIGDLVWLEELVLSCFWYAWNGEEYLRYQSYNRGDSNKITILPISLGNLQNLKAIYLYDNPISDLTQLTGLEQLQILDCSATQINNLIPLFRLSRLQYVDCRRTQVSDLTPLLELLRLKYLNCAQTQINDLTPLAGLTRLQMLDCRDTQANDLTPLSGLTRLQYLDCSSFEINDLTPLSGLVQLQSLRCSSSQVNDLAPLVRLMQLQTLFCYSTQINDLTPLSGLTQLRHLYFDSTRINDLTPLAGLIQLETLSCSSTLINDLTPLAELTQLQILYCRSTEINDLMPLAKLTKLRTLYCSETEINDLTPLAELKQLTSLECAFTQVSDLTPLRGLISMQFQHFYFDYTQVSDLSPILQLIKKGAGISVDNCPLTNPPLEIVKQGNEAILKYFDEIAHKHTFHNTEIKCIFVGNSTAGKTSLVDFLTKKQYQQGKTSTHGILSNRWQTNFLDQDLTVNIWDFGGQEYYHATHRLFLSHNAVYCLVWDAQTNRGGTCETEVFYDDEANPCYEEMEHHPVQWWLRNVRHFTATSNPPVPILLAQNKTECDKQQSIAAEVADFQLNDEWLDNHLSIEKAAEHLIEPKLETKKWARSFEAFEEKLLETLSSQCSRFKFPVYCRDVRDEINELKQSQKWLSRSDFENLCRKYDETAEILLIDIYLRDITGDILFYPNNPQLSDRVFFDSAWVCEQIYKVLSRDVRNKNNGVFDIHWVENALGVDAKEAERFLAIMREFELIFAETNEDGSATGNFVAPQYLPENCIDNTRLEELKDLAEFQPVFTLWFSDFLPKSVMARFIALHGVAAQKKLYWKNGLCLKVAGCYAFVERKNDNKIHVEIQVKKSQDEAARRILKTFLKIEESSPNFAISVDEQYFVHYRDLTDAFQQGAHV